MMQSKVAISFLSGVFQLDGVPLELQALGQCRGQKRADVSPALDKVRAKETVVVGGMYPATQIGSKPRLRGFCVPTSQDGMDILAPQAARQNPSALWRWTRSSSIQPIWRHLCL
ncbi:hypothetical protein PG993_003715 [Apiospora rasikravindrae]|uniref:Uncharacterized protein n=1 Tax=Apiospora rasikravindrae TaxID=990691 RepID=A0ABR1U0A3_9PEZI